MARQGKARLRKQNPQVHQHLGVNYYKIRRES